MLRKEFNSTTVDISELIIDWNTFYGAFVDKFNTAYQNANKKLHFDFIRSKDLSHTHVDGAKYNWIDPILLDTLICIISSVVPTDHRSRRRTFDQQKVLLECAVEALDMENGNKGWNSSIMKAIENTINLKTLKVKSESGNKINTRCRSSSTPMQSNEKTITLILKNLPENWSKSELFAKENDKITKSKKKRNEICEVLLKEIETRKQNLSSVVIEAVGTLIFTSDLEDYYRTSILNSAIESTKRKKNSNGKVSGRGSKRKSTKTNSKRKRSRSGKSNATNLLEIGDNNAELIDFGFGGLEDFGEFGDNNDENPSDTSNLSFDAAAEEILLSQNAARVHKTRSNSTNFLNI